MEGGILDSDGKFSVSISVYESLILYYLDDIFK